MKNVKVNSKGPQKNNIKLYNKDNLIDLNIASDINLYEGENKHNLLMIYDAPAGRHFFSDIRMIQA